MQLIYKGGSTEFGVVDASKAVLQQAARENASSVGKSNGEKEIEIEDGSNKHEAANGSPFPGHKKVGDMDDQEVVKKAQMPPASVMTRLILIMVEYSNAFIVKGSISILSDAGLGMAMFSLGLFMALQPKIIACGKSVATFSLAVRFFAGPAVIAAATIAIGLRGVLLHVAIVQAAPTEGIVPFVFTKEYNVHTDILSTV